MNDQSDLTLAFLQDKPVDAANTLGDLSGDDVASFLENVPAQISSPVIALMMPWKAAACLEVASPELSAEQLKLMEYQSAVGILRLIRPGNQAQILRQLPQSIRNKYKTSLSYPIDTAGALMDQSLPTFSANAKVEDALGYFKQSHAADIHHIFLLDEEKKLQGAVSVAELIKNSGQTKLDLVEIQNVPPVSSIARLAVVKNDIEWDEYPMRPVIDASRSMVGGLSRRALRRETSYIDQPTTPAPASFVASVFVMYLHCCQNIIGLTSQADGVYTPQNEGR